ncbi:MAG TPA: DUF4430 domain-containing protein [Patescibacteria group bacterium]|nr:DUF4430 domain-containing protein [Patescibacteria group bacterium]
MSLTIFFRRHLLALILWIITIILALISGYYAFYQPQASEFSSPDSISLASSTLNITKTTETTSLVNPQPDIEKTTEKKELAGESSSTPLVVLDKTATLKIANQEYLLSISATSTLYEQMQTLATNDPHFSFSGTDYGALGFFVEQINKQKNNTQTQEYWLYYLNGQPANIGISSYVPQSGDLIEWRYEKI